MSVSYISAELRRFVAARANYLCEYCLIEEEDTHLGCQVDHIISEKHGGTTTADNLAYACVFCNRNKGSDIGSVVAEKERVFCRFFDPRRDRWPDHFYLDLETMTIQPLSDVGRVTEKILGFNTSERVFEREILAAEQRYPSSKAQERIADQR